MRVYENGRNSVTDGRKPPNYEVLEGVTYSPVVDINLSVTQTDAFVYDHLESSTAPLEVLNT